MLTVWEQISEIPRLDNNRNFPERGVFRLQMGGGK